MKIRKNNQIKRDKSHNRLFLILLSFLVVFSGFIFPSNSEAEVISRGPSMKQVGPLIEFNGFPLWYKDSNNVKLQLCYDPNDLLCGSEEGIVGPISFPDNYPGEAFYQLAEAVMESQDGRSDAIGVFALEATFNQEVPRVGDQTVFGRIRFRVDGLVTGQTYTITHPYGVDKIVAADNEINYTEDIGAGQAFSGALNSRIGTFLTWDPNVAPAAPEGYIGNPAVLHQVTGGVNDQNFFRIEGPGIDNVYPNFACPDRDDCIQTNMFTLAGKYATNMGLDIQQATYNQTTADSGSIDVFVYSEVDQTIEVSGEGIVNTNIAGGNYQYYTHIPYEGAEPPREITVKNLDDTPDTVKTIALVDRIKATADYNPIAKTLTVTAKSSDEIDPPTLSVNGFGDIPETGVLVIPDVSYISPTITVTSSNNGTVTIPVNITFMPSIPQTIIPVTGLDQSIIVGTQSSITLDGSGSIGNIQSYAWTQVSGPETVNITNANTAIASFVTPTATGDYVFELTVTGENGFSTSKTTMIKILPKNTDPDPIPDPIANAGPDQTVKQGTEVKLDASGSENETAYSWKQVGEPTVLLNNVNTANPTFTFPKQPIPLVFELTVTGSDGKTATDTVEISTNPDNLTVTEAAHRPSAGNWWVVGTSDVMGPDVFITIKYIDSANPTGKLLGSTQVKNNGDWLFQLYNSELIMESPGTLIIESSSGGTLSNIPIEVRM